MSSSDKHPLVSVVMPVYNGSRYLREAIDSILSQTYSNFELYIVNDGSTDDSENIIKSYTDPRVKYLANKRNSGICVTLNKGLSASTGKYIARMDCDDISMPHRFEIQVAYLETHPEVGIVGSDIVTFGEGLEDRYFDFLHDRESCKAGLIFNTCFAHPSVMIRRDVLSAHQLYYDDEFRGVEDYELWCRMARYTHLFNINQPLLHYRLHKNQVTQNVTQKVSEKGIELRTKQFLAYADLDKEELGLLMNYCHSQWNFFTKENFPILFKALRKIAYSPLSRKEHAFHKAMQVTLSKALVYTINQAKIPVSRPWVYTKALCQGIMPFDWYCKFMYQVLPK